MIIELTPEDKKALKTALVFGSIDTEKVPTLKKIFEKDCYSEYLKTLSDSELRKIAYGGRDCDVCRAINSEED